MKTQNVFLILLVRLVDSLHVLRGEELSDFFCPSNVYFNPESVE